MSSPNIQTFTDGAGLPASNPAFNSSFTQTDSTSYGVPPHEANEQVHRIDTWETAPDNSTIAKAGQSALNIETNPFVVAPTYANSSQTPDVGTDMLAHHLNGRCDFGPPVNRNKIGLGLPIIAKSGRKNPPQDDNLRRGGSGAARDERPDDRTKEKIGSINPLVDKTDILCEEADDFSKADSEAVPAERHGNRREEKIDSIQPLVDKTDVFCEDEA
jgi:hypothetical protein